MTGSATSFSAPTLVHVSSIPQIGRWDSRWLANATGSIEQHIGAYLRDASWPFETVQTTVADYADYVADGDPERLRHLLPTAIDSHGIERGYDPRLDITFYGALLVAELSDAVRHEAYALAGEASESHSTHDAVMRIYLSRRGSTSGLHWDGRAATLVQLDGIKDAILLPPSDTNRLLPFPSNEGPNSEIDPFDDAQSPPLAHPQRFTLRPGDALDIPVGWWHCFRASSENSTSLSIMWPDE